MNKILVVLSMIVSSQAMASDFTPYLGLNLGFHSSKGENTESNKNGFSLGAKVLGSWEFDKAYVDATVGYHWMQLSDANIKITTRSVYGELETRYKLSSSWSVGPAVRVLAGTDNTNAESVGSDSTHVSVLGKVMYQTLAWDLPARLEVGAGSTVGLERNLTTVMVGFQIALPWGNKKKNSVTTTTYVTEELPDLKVDLKVAQVKFSTDKFQLSTSDTVKLQKLAIFLRENNTEWSRMKIAGHTDVTGDSTYNRALSQDRADSVMKVFASQGVNELKMSAYGYGATRPVDSSNSTDAWAKNRRTEIEFFGVKNRTEFNKKLMEILK